MVEMNKLGIKRSSWSCEEIRLEMGLWRSRKIMQEVRKSRKNESISIDFPKRKGPPSHFRVKREETFRST